MTRDDIIRMAREASNTPIDHHATPDLFGVNQLERFAQLVEKRKCEELARKIEAMPFGTTGESFAVWVREQAHED